MIKEKKSIHTTLKHSTIRKLESIGGGRLNDGIERAVTLAESKEFNTKNELMKIADFILHEKSEV